MNDIIDVNKIGAFRYWCNKILPLTYDDSLSYYEVLCKMTNYLNTVIEHVDNLSDNQRIIYNALTQLQDYVNHYFDNLNIQSEINNKLDEMFASGELGEALSEIYISKTITSYHKSNDKDYTAAFKRYFKDIESGKKIGLVINTSEIHVSETIEIPLFKNWSIQGLSRNTTVYYDGDNSVMFENNRVRAGYAYITGIISNVTFIDEKKTNTFLREIGSSTSNLKITDCIINSFKTGLYIEDAWLLYMTNTSIINGVNGVVLFTPNGSSFINCEFNFLTGTPIKFETTPGKDSYTTKFSITNCTIEGGTSSIINNTKIQALSITDLFVEPKDNNSWFENNGYLSSPIFKGIRSNEPNHLILNNAKNATIIGCYSPISLSHESSQIYIINNPDYFTISGLRECKSVYFIGQIKSHFPSLGNDPITLSLKANIPAYTGYFTDAYYIISKVFIYGSTNITIKDSDTGSILAEFNSAKNGNIFDPVAMFQALGNKSLTITSSKDATIQMYVL